MGATPAPGDRSTTMHNGGMDPLIAWFEASARPLPWRETRDPWGIYVSEIMGQQTPMSRVVPRWQEWLDRWPTPTALAAATEAEVLRAWQSLGYPRRALALHRAAAVIRDEHGGQVPHDREALLGLPGVGPYTASAILAFAFGEEIAVIDTNVRRVLARYTGTPPGRPADEAARLLDLLPEPKPLASEALMELGAIHCKPAPLCGDCPLARTCAWHGVGEDPAPARRPQAFTGTDRQARGKIMAHLRDSHWAPRPVLLELARVSDDDAQPPRALDSLVADRLVSEADGGYRLGR